MASKVGVLTKTYNADNYHQFKKNKQSEIGCCQSRVSYNVRSHTITLRGNGGPAPL